MSAMLDQATIPAFWYVDPHVYELEQELIFRRTWQWVGRTDQLASPGAYFTCEVAGEPILVVRDEDGALRAFSNVCRHKAGPVAQGNGILKHFRCVYHGWTYGLDGSLLGTPHFKDVEGFTREANCLPRIQVDAWGPLVFVNLDPDAPSLMEVLRHLPERFARYSLDELIFHKGTAIEAACNWKVWEENGRECYHCPTIHPSFRVAYQVEDAELEVFDLCSLMFMPERCGLPSQATDQVESVVESASNILGFRRQFQRGELRGKETTGNYTLFMFPNFVLSLQPDHVFASKRVPTAVDRVTLIREYFVWKGHEIDIEDNWALRLQTLKEDAAICEEAQKGLRSRYFKHGWYSPKELLVHHFDSLLKRFLGSSLTPE